MRYNHFCVLLATVVVGGFTASVLGCGEPTIDEEEAATYADEWSQTVHEQLENRAVEAAGSEALREQLREAAEQDRRVVRSEEPLFALLVEEVYEERDFEPALVDAAELTGAGEAVLEALEQVEDHNLDAGPYQLDEIEEAIDTWRQRVGSVEDFDGLEATDQDRRQAASWLVEQPESQFELTETNYERLTEELLEHVELGGRLESVIDEYGQKRGAIAQAAATVEKLLVMGLARYAAEQRHSRIKDIFVHPRHWDYYNEPDVEDSGRRPDPQRGAFLGGQIWRDAAHLAEEITEENKTEILDERIQQTVREVIESDDPHRRVAEIPPQHPQYQGLVEEYRRYRDIVDDGGWSEVPRDDHLALGQSSETVTRLKERLQIEGYYPEDADIDDTFDEALADAIREYQETHQLMVDGRPNHVFWYSLNISAQRRLNQIGLNLDRWRQSNIDHSEPKYAFVNIPDFTIELWHEQQRDMRFATIVGDNEKDINPLTDEEEYSNRTPVPMAAYIDRVIYNPYWNVTDRIRAQRILPDVKESVETKYALKFDHYLQGARRGDERVASQEVTLASITAAVGLPDDDEDDEEFGEMVSELDIDEFDDEQLQERLAEYVGQDDEIDSEMDDDGVDRDELYESVEEDDTVELTLDDLTESQRQELKTELVAEKTRQALADWTKIEEVRNEEHDRIEHERFFRTSRLEQLKSDLFGDDSEEFEEFRQRFPYLDWETGEVDVEQTDPDHIPSWYEENNYEVVNPGHETWEYVRMLPGEENSLGFVKIIFPNYDNIYLHDTPDTYLFSSQVRGYSHGCIRLEQPLTLSERLVELGADKQVDSEEIIESEEYLPIFLDRQIPVYLEYYTVRVDDEGRANFLADIYDYDEEALGESS